jgi:hypothetical protein
MKKFRTLLLVIAYIAALFIVSFAITGGNDFKTELSAENLSEQENGLFSEGFSLGKGVYRLNAVYNSETEWNYEMTGYQLTLKDNSEDYYSYLKSELVTLFNYRNSASIYAYAEQPIDARIAIYRNECEDPLIIQSVSLEYLHTQTAIVLFAKLFLISIIVWILAMLLLKKDQKLLSIVTENRNVLIIGGMVLLVTCLPMTLDYLLNGFDQSYHYYRIYTIAEGLKNGVFPVKVHAEWLQNYGYASGTFYGDMFLYFPAVLYLLGFPIWTAYKILVIVTNIFTMVFGYYCFKAMSGNKNIAILGSSLYTLSLPRLYATYTRGAYGVASAAMLLPLIVLGAYYIYFESKEKHNKGALYIAIGLVGLLNSHMIGTVVSIIFLVVFALIRYKKTFTKEVLVAIGKTALLTLALGAAYIVPFIDAFMHIDMKVSYESRPLYHGSAYLAQIFADTFNVLGDVREDGTGMHNDMGMSVGLMGLMVLGVAVYFLLSKYREDKKKNVRDVFALSMIALWMASNLFPYNWISRHIPKLYHFFECIQYGWRFLVPAGLFISILAVLLAKYLYAEHRTALVKALIVIFCMAFCYQGAKYIFDFNNDAPRYEAERRVQDYTHKAQYSGQYLPNGFDLGDINHEISVQDGADVTATMTGRRGNRVDAYIANGSSSDAVVEFPLLYYYGYEARDVVSGQKLEIGSGSNFRVSVTVPAGFNGNVAVCFREPVLWRISEIFSLIMIVVVGVYYYVKQKRMGTAAVADNK